MLEQEPNNRDEADEDADAGERRAGTAAASPRAAACCDRQRLPGNSGEDDRDEVADRRENEEARVALGGLEVAGGGKPDEEADVHAGVIPEKSCFATGVSGVKRCVSIMLMQVTLRPLPVRKSARPR